METYCRPLLRDDPTSPTLDFNPSLNSGAMSPDYLHSPAQTANTLPIASRYASASIRFPPRLELLPTPFEDHLKPIPDARLAAYHVLTNGQGGPLDRLHKPSAASLKHPRSHQSLPPQRIVRSQQSSYSSARLSQQSGRKADGRTDSISSILGATGVQLPTSLRHVLSAIADGMLGGHAKLVDALKRRYDDQYPLVRSLADVFAAHVGLHCTRGLNAES